MPTELAAMLHTLGGKASGSSWMMRCPAHNDKVYSLSVDIGQHGKVLTRCHAGCTWDDIYPHIKDLLPEAESASKPAITDTYQYTDLRGTLLYEVCRFTPKGFRQRRPVGNDWLWNLEGVSRVPYRWAEAAAAAAEGRVLFVCEGEKDVETLRALSFAATCIAGGASAALPDSFVDLLKSAPRVVYLPDNDEPGEAFMQRIRHAVGHGVTVTISDEPKGDVSDWVAAGGNADQFKEIIRLAVSKPPEPLPQGAQADQADRAILLLRDARRMAIPMPFFNVALITGPMLRHSIWYAAAFSGRGKTSFTLSLCEKWAQAGLKVYYLGLEMRPEELRIQWACRASGADPEKVLTGEAPAEVIDAVMRRLIDQRDQAAAAARDPSRFAQLPLARIQFSGVPAIDVAALRQEVHLAATLGCDVFVVDHMDHVSSDNPHGDAATSRDANRAMEQLAKEFPMLFWLTSQANNEIMRGDVLGSYAPLQPNHLWFPGVKMQISSGMISLHRPLLREPEGIDEGKRHKEQLRRVRAGTLDVSQVLTQHQMVATLMKSRLAGHRLGQSANLHITHGHVRDWTSDDSFKYFGRV